MGRVCGKGGTPPPRTRMALMEATSLGGRLVRIDALYGISFLNEGQ